MNATGDFLTWGALILAAGSVTAVITFWFNRGKAEAQALAKAETAEKTAMTAQASATAALARAELVASDLSKACIEFARDYATHDDLTAASNRTTEEIRGMRSDLRGLNDRLDRLIEKKGL